MAERRTGVFGVVPEDESKSGQAKELTREDRYFPGLGIMVVSPGINSTHAVLPTYTARNETAAMHDDHDYNAKELFVSKVQGPTVNGDGYTQSGTQPAPQWLDKAIETHKQVLHSEDPYADQKLAEKKPASDPVNHPSHYKQGNIEVIDFIEDQKFGYLAGQVVKHVARARHKGSRLEDYKKAEWYLRRLIARKGLDIGEKE